MATPQTMEQFPTTESPIQALEVIRRYLLAVASPDVGAYDTG